MDKEQRRFDKAAEKVQMIAPLLVEGLSRNDRIELQKGIAIANGLSYRTVGRLVNRYKAGRIEGLMPQDRTREDLKVIPDHVVQQAVILRREQPSRSIADIIFILEGEGFVQPGILKRSTLQHRMAEAGYSHRQMELYVKTPELKAMRRFQKEHRMVLLQGDIKYGPYLPIGPNGELVQTYWAGWIDDCTRYITYGRFYADQTATTVKNSLMMSLAKCGKPDSILMDNGTQYKSFDMKATASALGIKVRYARPYSPETKGKIEFYNSLLSKYIEESSLKNFTTLEMLNSYYIAWQEEWYHKQPHGSLKLKTPEETFLNDTRPLRHIDQAALDYAMKERVLRVVSKENTVSFEGTVYEVSSSLGYRTRVALVIDRRDLSKVVVERDGFDPCEAKVRTIGPDVDYKSRAKAKYKGVLETGTSRLLDVAAKKYKEHHPDTDLVFDDPVAKQEGPRTSYANLSGGKEKLT